MSSIQKTIMIAGLLTAGLAQSLNAGAADNITWTADGQAPGVYFYWYEPSFYTGFAPRTQDPDRVHLELGRGNQQRLTIVLGPDEIDVYPENLLAKRDLVNELVDKGVIKLTTNKEFERFSQTLEQAGIPDLVAAKPSMPGDEYRARSLEIMEQLNPQRIFRIKMPMARVAADWHGVLSQPDADELDAANAVLPGRINLYKLDDVVKAELAKAMEMARSGMTPTDPAFVQQTAAFLASATEGRYAVNDDAVQAVEFTAIYPAGTAKAWTTYKGEKLPDFGVTGVWPLLVREHGKGVMGMVDYLSTNPGYGYIPLLGYQYAGGVAYNALHNAGVRSQLDSAKFLPPEWRMVAGEATPEKNYQNLWIGSRGPASHGCTRLPSGHMSELRDALPSTSEALEGIPNFRNKPHCYDVFDIDGDGSAEVMGVKYYLAYWGEKHLPVAAYAPNDRKGFYAWLYKDNIEYAADGSATIKEVPVCRFVGLHKAEDSTTLSKVSLYEAPYARESIQFYRTEPVDFKSKKGFEFNREMRRIGAGYDLDPAALLVD